MRSFRNQYVEPVTLFKAIDKVCPGHRVFASEQPDFFETVGSYILCSGIHNMEEGKINGCLNLFVGGVNGITGQQEEVCACSLQFFAFSCEQFTDQVPAAFTLSALNFLKVRLGKYQFSAVPPFASKTFCNELIDDAVVNN